MYRSEVCTDLEGVAEYIVGEMREVAETFIEQLDFLDQASARLHRVYCMYQCDDHNCVFKRPYNKGVL